MTRVQEGKRPLGASTITQQVAKNMLLDNRITLKRKVEEAILAVRMEQTLSKQRILELYLNEIYLGQGAYGVEAAAQAYFNRPLDQLSLAQDAMLAALPKAPQNYNPFRHPEQARGAPRLGDRPHGRGPRDHPRRSRCRQGRGLWFRPSSAAPRRSPAPTGSPRRYARN